MTEYHSLAHAKAHLSEILDLIESTQEHVVITRRGRPVAVLVHPDDLEGLELTLEVLATPGALDEIRTAEREIAEGKGLSAAELRDKYLKK